MAGSEGTDVQGAVAAASAAPVGINRLAQTAVATTQCMGFMVTSR